jgi:hypothetical protein
MKNYKINYDSFFGFILFWIFRKNYAQKNAQLGVVENEIVLKTDIYEGKIKRLYNYLAFFARYIIPFTSGLYFLVSASHSNNISILFFSLIFTILITLAFTKTNFLKIKIVYMITIYFLLLAFFTAFIFFTFDYSFFRSVMIYSLNYFVVALVFYKILFDFLLLKKKKFFYLWEKRLVIYV